MVRQGDVGWYGETGWVRVVLGWDRDDSKCDEFSELTTKGIAK
jgi:hypothetical protein